MSEFRRMVRGVNTLLLVLKWLLVIGIAALIFWFVSSKISQQDRISDIMEQGTDKPIK